MERNYVVNDGIREVKNANSVTVREYRDEKKIQLPYHIHSGKIVPNLYYPNDHRAVARSKESGENPCKYLLPRTGWVKGLREERKKKQDEIQRLNNEKKQKEEDEKVITVNLMDLNDEEIDLNVYEVEMDKNDLKEFQEFQRIKKKVKEMNKELQDDVNDLKNDFDEYGSNLKVSSSESVVNSINMSVIVEEVIIGN
uniref:Uncharacterized protein n=1 Tax=Pithovirus LCPAC001 TaxID=2506585 RepID=A0A481Z219_9VIRU|nr:MAG: hypothetical protein LCPAC001_02280 [Pithovirus LCPAC001]